MSGTANRVALVGNPNAGKTTLFNALTGLRAKTANFPGTTIEHRSARMRLNGHDVQLVDLPGTYSLNSVTPEERVAREALDGELKDGARPDAVILLLDATQLERNLYLASQVLELGLPTVVALNMVDLARREGIRIDTERLQAELGCPVVPLVARTGSGLAELRAGLTGVLERSELPDAPAGESACGACGGCAFRQRFDWAESVGTRCMTGRRTTAGRQTEKLDALLTHPVVGVVAFLSVMVAIF